MRPLQCPGLRPMTEVDCPEVVGPSGGASWRPSQDIMRAVTSAVHTEVAYGIRPGSERRCLPAPSSKPLQATSSDFFIVAFVILSFIVYFKSFSRGVESANWSNTVSATETSSPPINLTNLAFSLGKYAAAFTTWPLRVPFQHGALGEYCRSGSTSVVLHCSLFKGILIELSPVRFCYNLSPVQPSDSRWTFSSACSTFCLLPVDGAGRR